MNRDRNAEGTEIDAEFYDAKAALDAAPVSPELGNMTELVSLEDLAAFGEANRRFEAAEARRSAFLAEPRALDPNRGGSAKHILI